MQTFSFILNELRLTIIRIYWFQHHKLLINAFGHLILATMSELSQCGWKGALNSVVAQGSTWEEAPSKLGWHGWKGALDTVMVQGFTWEEAPSELGRRGHEENVHNYLMQRGITSELASMEYHLELHENRRLDPTNNCKTEGCRIAPIISGLCQPCHRKAIEIKSKKIKAVECKRCSKIPFLNFDLCRKCYESPDEVMRRRSMHEAELKEKDLHVHTWFHKHLSCLL